PPEDAAPPPAEALVSPPEAEVPAAPEEAAPVETIAEAPPAPPKATATAIVGSVRNPDARWYAELSATAAPCLALSRLLGRVARRAHDEVYPRVFAGLVVARITGAHPADSSQSFYTGGRTSGRNTAIKPSSGKNAQI
ncbi:MAG: hypothetical protein ACTS5I_04915, partial [Rhodanobacter sp.]